MYVVFLAGGTGSGKSTVATQLKELGCVRIDLDQISREVLAPNAPLLVDIAKAFGADLVDAQGRLDRQLLAQRAFATEEAAERLEALELPAIRALLEERLAEAKELVSAPCCIVEVPLLDRMVDAFDLADEIVVVWCPLALRRERAIARGMVGEDFDARVRRQPTDEWLKEHADALIDNTGSSEELAYQVRRWFDQHEEEGWQ